MMQSLLVSEETTNATIDKDHFFLSYALKVHPPVAEQTAVLLHWKP